MPVEKGCIEMVERELLSRIKFAVEWDGYHGEDMEKAYDVAAEFGYLFGFRDTYRAAKRTRVPEVSEGEEPYQKMIAQLDKAQGQLREIAIQIATRAFQIGQPCAEIPASYFDSIVVRWVAKNKKDLVLIAPHLWLPTSVSEETANQT